MKTQYDNYPICHVSREVRDYLRESDKELKRQRRISEGREARRTCHRKVRCVSRCGRIKSGHPDLECGFLK